MDRRRLCAGLASTLVVFVGCSASTANTDRGASADRDSSSEVGESRDASSDRAAPTSDPQSDAAPVDATSSTDARASLLGESWDGRAPQTHVASGSACPQQRGPGLDGCNPDGGLASPTAVACLRDSDCTAGESGRCNFWPVSSPPPSEAGSQLVLPLCGSTCSYDTCFSDSDCPPRVPCGCRSSPSAGAANVCLTGSNCAVDSDCGPGGFCSPDSSQQTQGLLLYFCHTANDACLDNSDCPNGGCQHDSTSARWICVTAPPIMR
jgi:hypothetical protein